MASATSRPKVGITSILATFYYVIPTERIDEESAGAPVLADQCSLENRRLQRFLSRRLLRNDICESFWHLLVTSILMHMPCSTPKSRLDDALGLILALRRDLVLIK